jgi:Tfp pilus assembly protein PilN
MLPSFASWSPASGREELISIVNIRLNLASKPFANRALPWILVATLVFSSVLALVFILRAASGASTTADLAQTDVSQLKLQQLELEKQIEAVKQTLTPEQLKTLDAAHELVARKEFSWSRLFVDLENTLPGPVRVTRISVRDVAAGDVTVADLDLTVAAESPTIVTDMIANMERTGVFQPVLRSQNARRGRGESVTEYELSVRYSPATGRRPPDEQVAPKAQGVMAAAEGTK